MNGAWLRKYSCENTPSRRAEASFNPSARNMIMPKMAGGETFDKLKAINPKVKIVLSSGFSIDGEASKIIERGCDGFIQKPFDVKELTRKIREILDRKPA